MNEETVTVPAELVESISCLVEGLSQPAGTFDHASQLIELHNDLSQLFTWHPRWNEFSGFVDHAGEG